MGYLKFLLNIGLILATSTIPCTNGIEEIIERLPDNTIPIHYNIKLTVHLEEGDFNFSGETNVNIEIRRASPSIKLHMRYLQINFPATTLINNEGRDYKPKEHFYNYSTNVLTLNFDRALSLGAYTLNMKFAGQLTEVGYVKHGFLKLLQTDDNGNSTWVAATILEPNAAKQVFPCWDEPALKATFNISVTHLRKYRALSNMPIQQEFPEQNDMVRTQFQTTPKMSTYLVAIVVADFVRVSNADGTINMWCASYVASKVKYSLSIAEMVKLLLVQYTKIPEKVPKMDHVVVQNYPADGMENWGLIIYKEPYMLYDDSLHASYTKLPIVSLVTHELAHQWFGNLITPAWWPYVWLSEGVAVYLETYIHNKTFEKWQLMDFFVVETMHDSMTLDVGFLNSVTLQIENSIEKIPLFSTEVYKKAPALLRMLSIIITEDIFRKGLITYLASHEFSSVTPDDLWNAMQSALDHSDVPHEGYRIKEVMDTWMNQRLLPVVNVIRDYETGKVTLSQEPIRQYEETAQNKWWIPVTFTTQSNPDFSNTIPSHWLRPDQNITLNVNSNDWIIVNLQQAGYYRVNYDTRNWNSLIQYLNSEEYTKIHPLNRAQIINDAFAFAMESDISGPLIVDITRYLSRETDYKPWQAMFRILKIMMKNLFLPEARYTKTMWRDNFNSILQKLGYYENPNDDDITKRTRLRVLDWACLLEHGECLRMAAVRLNEHFADPNRHKILPGWKEWMYCNGLKTVNNSITWNKLFDLYRDKPSKSLLKSLSCAGHSHLIISYLIIMSTNDSIYNETMHYHALTSIIENHARDYAVLDYILKNFDSIKPRSVKTIVLIKLILDNVYSEARFNQVKEFANTLMNQDPDTSSAIEKLIEKRKVSFQIEELLFKYVLQIAEFAQNPLKIF